MRRWPAEWEPQSGVLLTWPHADSDWAPLLDAVEPVYARLSAQIARREAVWIACPPDGVVAVRDRLGAAGVDLARIHLYECPSNDTWSRDHGPLVVLEQGQPLLLDFRFNGWGGKFAAALDDRLTGCLHAAGAFGRHAREHHDFVLEGGSIDSDGQGSVLTTARCLLAPGRNPDMNRAGIEHKLRATLGAERVLWLEQGELAGDDTDAHIDTLARFCAPDTIAYVRCDDPHDPHHAELAAMEHELQNLRTAAGRPYRLIPLPWPRACFEQDRRLPATYANFLVINGAVLVPTYDDPADAIALDRLASAFAQRAVIGIDCRPLIRQNGSLHCITMQLPAGVLPDFTQAARI